MDPRTIEAVIAKRFRLERAPTFVAPVGASRFPLIFTHLRSIEGQRRLTMDVPREQSFSFQVPLTAFPWQAWFAGKEKIVSPATPGNAYLFDLSNNPTVGLNTAFNTVRFNISQAAIDEHTRELGLRRSSGLRAPSMGCQDPIMHSLAQTLVAALERPSEGMSAFIEYIALAFSAHVIHTYGNVPVGSISTRGGLAPWQLRRARAFIEANLDGDPSIADIAVECGLSSSHFAKAFKQAVGVPPHAWLLMRRIECAKKLLRETRLELSEIAHACGFVDQSHLSRAFVKSEGCSPGKWRRCHQN